MQEIIIKIILTSSIGFYVGVLGVKITPNEYKFSDICVWVVLTSMVIILASIIALIWI